MDRLPIELKHLILQACDFKDLLSMRLVDRSLGEAGRAIAFETVAITPFSFSMFRLDNLSSTDYARFVRRIVVYLDSFAQGEGWDPYQYDEDSREETSVLFDEYNTLRADELEMEQPAAHRPLYDALKSLPYLREVHLTTLCHKYGNFRSPKPSIAMLAAINIEAYETSTLSYKLLHTVLTAMHGRMSSGLSPVTSLSISIEDHDEPDPVATLLERNTWWTTERACKLFGHLQYFSAYDALGEGSTFLSDTATFMLQHTSQLRSIRLAFTPFDRYAVEAWAPEEYLNGMSSVLGRLVWPQLRKISLNLMLMDNDFVAFLHRHPQLEALSLAWCSFEDFDRMMHAIKDLNTLQDVHLLSIEHRHPDHHVSRFTYGLSAAQKVWLQTGDGEATVMRLEHDQNGPQRRMSEASDPFRSTAASDYM